MSRLPDPQLALDWRERLDWFDRSDWTIAEFCRLDGCFFASFYQWRRWLRGAPLPAAPAFVPVDLNGDRIDHRGDPPAQPSCRIEVPGGAVVTIPLGVNLDQQCDLLTAVVRATAPQTNP